MTAALARGRASLARRRANCASRGAARRAAPPRLNIASRRDVPVGTSLVFTYPTEHDRCLLIRLEDAVLLAYSQSCTHLSGAVVPRIADGVLHSPCHEG